MPTRKPRRKKSPLIPTLLLFGVGVACVLGAAVLWLLSPAPAPPVAIVPPTSTPEVAAAPETPAPAAPAPAMPTATPLAATPAPRPSPVPVASPLAVTSAAPGSGRPRLAIIIDDCGQWPVTERGFLALPFPVTLSVLPHVRYGPAIAREADAAGKGVMLHLPMQTISGQYPGPGTITVAMDDAAIRSEDSGDLAELPQARGVNNHEGSLATANRRVMDDVADVLARDGRFWIDSRTSAASVAAAVTRGRGIPSASRDVFLDNVDSVGAVEAQLREAATMARADGSAIAIGHPRPATLLAVRTLGPILAANGIDLTLASSLVR